MKRLGIFGTSGFAREIGDIAWELSYEPLYIARDEAELAQWDGQAEAVLESETERWERLPLAIGIGNPKIRQRLLARHKELQFINLIHPDSSFGRGQREALANARGVIVAAGARLTNRIRIGDFTVFDRNATVGHDCIIENFVHVAPAACISGNVHIQTGCWVGAGAVVNQGSPHVKLLIGNGSIIGSGAVVIAPCEANSVYAGVPAKRIK